MRYRNNDNGRDWAWIVGVFGIVVGLFLAAILVYGNVSANYSYKKKYSYHWHLSDKSSTILAKENHINAFVQALKDGKARGEFSDNNAIFLKTPDNSFDANFIAVETLASRLKEIQKMDPKSFEYNTAIQQITAQEQGEADKLMSVFYGCYELSNYFYVWEWIGVLFSIAVLMFLAIGIICLLYWLDA